MNEEEGKMTQEKVRLTTINDSYDVLTLLNAQPVIVTVIDPRSYTVLYQNGTGEGQLGKIKGKLCYQNIPKLGNACPFCKMGDAIKTGQVQSSEVQLPDGTWLLVQFAPIRKPDGTMDIVESITNISEQKKREEELSATVALLLEREEKIAALREQVRTLGVEPAA